MCMIRPFIFAVCFHKMGYAQIHFVQICTSKYVAFHCIFRLGEEAEEECKDQKSQPEHAVERHPREAGGPVGHIPGNGVCADACHLPGAVQLAQQ